MSGGAPALLAILSALFGVVLLRRLHLQHNQFAGDAYELGKSEAGLAKARDILRIHFENGADMSLSLDPQLQRVTHCNAAIAAKLGYSKRELIDRPQLNLYAPACRELASTAFARLLANGRIDDVELQALCKDGSLLDVRLSALLVRDRQGGSQYCDVVWQDTSQRRKSEALVGKRDKQITTLYLLGEQMLRHNNLHALMHSVAFGLFQTLSVRSILVCELCHSSRSLIVQAAIGGHKCSVRSVAPHKIQPGSLPALVLAQGGPLHISGDVCPEWLDGMSCLEGASPKYGVATVIKNADEPVGLIMAFHDSSNFSAEDIDYIQSLANMLSIATDRIRLEDKIAHTGYSTHKTGHARMKLARDWTRG